MHRSLSGKDSCLVIKDLGVEFLDCFTKCMLKLLKCFSRWMPYFEFKTETPVFAHICKHVVLLIVLVLNNGYKVASHRTFNPPHNAASFKLSLCNIYILLPFAHFVLSVCFLSVSFVRRCIIHILYGIFEKHV